jgi:transcription antitermination protein NusB
MQRRSRAREVALQLLFQADQNKKPMSPKAVQKFLQDRLLGDEPSIAFANSLFDGVLQHRTAIDQTLVATATNWRLPRMLPSDRNILRLATFELLHRSEVEAIPVILNEAIELAKRFGTAESAGFVNGILDQISKQRLAKVAPPVIPADPAS